MVSYNNMFTTLSAVLWHHISLPTFAQFIWPASYRDRRYFTEFHLGYRKNVCLARIDRCLSLIPGVIGSNLVQTKTQCMQFRGLNSLNENLRITDLCLISLNGLFKMLHNNVGYKVGMLTHKYEYKPERKMKVSSTVTS